MSEQNVISCINIDNYISSSVCCTCVKIAFFFFFLGRKLLGRNLLGAYRLLDPSVLAVCIKILYNSTTDDLTISGLELWLLLSLFRFLPLHK